MLLMSDNVVIVIKNKTDVQLICHMHPLLQEQRTLTMQFFLPFNTPIRKIVFCPERDSNPRLPDY